MSGVLTLSGGSGDFASTPGAAPLDIVGDIDIRVKVAMVDWTPAATPVLIGKDLNTPNKSYTLYVQATGKPALAYSVDGTATTVKASTAATGFTDGTAHWVRVTMDVDNGADGNDIKFYTSDEATNDPDAVSWSQLGTTVTTGGVVAIASTASNLEVGAYRGGSLLLAGDVYAAQVRSGIGGTVVFDADFTDLTAGEVAAKAFTEDSTNAATVTLNGSAWTYDYGVTINRTNIIFVAAD